MFLKHNFLPKILTAGFSLVILLITGSQISTLAQQSSTNTINLGITKVVKDQKDENTKQAGTNIWRYSGDLTANDAIKYKWSGVDLNVKYKTTPSKGAGYLKIYKDDDSKDTNLITEYGNSPLGIDKIVSRLTDGENKILFVYIDSNNKVGAKVLFYFNYKNTVNPPKINVLEPSTGIVLGKNIDYNVTLKLDNFALESKPSNQPNRGHLQVYYNEVKPSNLALNLNSSKDLGNAQSEVRFNTKDLNFEKLKVADSTQTKLIFVLAKTTDEILPYQSEFIIQTNYNNSLNVGLPKVSIVEPRKDRTDLNVDGDRKFILEVSNFTILTERKEGQNEPKTGYLQIFVDEVPRKTIFPETEFSLNELGLTDLTKGRKTIKVQLVNKDFTKFAPEATDSIEVIYSPKISEKTEANLPQVQNNNWRIIIVILTVILVIGGIAVLITKG